MQADLSENSRNAVWTQVNAWLNFDKTENLSDPIQSYTSETATHSWCLRGFRSFWVFIEVKRNQIRLTYLSEKLSYLMSYFWLFPTQEKGPAMCRPFSSVMEGKKLCQRIDKINLFFPHFCESLFSEDSVNFEFMNFLILSQGTFGAFPEVAVVETRAAGIAVCVK